MKRNKSSKTAFDLMRHYELKTCVEGIAQTYFFLRKREGLLAKTLS